MDYSSDFSKTVCVRADQHFRICHPIQSSLSTTNCQHIRVVIEASRSTLFLVRVAPGPQLWDGIVPSQAGRFGCLDINTHSGFFVLAFDPVQWFPDGTVDKSH